MALTTAIIRTQATPKKKPFRLADENGLYLLVQPNGTCFWRLHYQLKGKKYDTELGDYPTLSLSNARKRQAAMLRLVMQGIDPMAPIPKSHPPEKTEKQLTPPPILEPAAAPVKKKDKQKKGAAEQLPRLPLIAYKLNNLKMPLVAGFNTREWMDMTSQRFAYRCMPMLIANQAGWMLLGSHGISAIWDGRQTHEGLKITCIDGTPPANAVSMFGSGIITFTIPYLFRTPPGYNLLVMGPPNWPKDGVCALSGIVETDWAESTFTMNWKITRPHHVVTFEKEEPICMVVPQKRYEVESFVPVVRDINADPQLKADYVKWAESRQQFNQDLKIYGSQAQKEGWQKHYAQGRTVSEKRSTVHQSKLNVREFVVEPPVTKE